MARRSQSPQRAAVNTSRRRITPSTLAAPAQGWASAHARCLIESLGRLHRRWVASLLTTFVIGIALALPAGLYVLMTNLDTLSQSWHRAVQASLYLEDSVDTARGEALAEKIAGRDSVAETRFISAQAGLEQFRESSGFGAALDALEDNPLPAVIVVTPRPEMPRAEVGELLVDLESQSGVARAELDQAWLARLYAILSVIERSAWVIGLLLSVAVLFIVGNTIRLDIENRREEIEVMKLLGASDAFIRRPFLYSGFWYGLVGAILALLLLGACFIALAEPLGALTRSYDGALALHGLSFKGVLVMLGTGVGLGWAGCALTVNRRLAAIEPR
ncbi:permease-like cell division protein FtsX [Salinisphaera sp.]|uniref:permease-like cell division protein FtsX n=1 Tax=Salinisphaera sp. TaxID=1914330 RepID=UPI000C5CA382|nr:permease-like cell division protein FtsX [Salinisphaera sp.]MAS09983.1 cell division protein FtsX [Salinisphaera sp.]